LTIQHLQQEMVETPMVETPMVETPMVETHTVTMAMHTQKDLVLQLAVAVMEI
jgi:acetamidase/formamidase